MREADEFSMADAGTAKCPSGYYTAMRKDEIDWVPAPYFRQITNLPVTFTAASDGIPA
jgi:hypothetical protein